MMRIHYAGGTGLTGDAIAQALINLARQLAANGAAKTVDIPTRNPNGTVGRSTFLIGPTSQIFAEPEQSGYEEIYDVDLVHDLERQISVLKPHPVSSEPAEVNDIDLELDAD